MKKNSIIVLVAFVVIAVNAIILASVFRQSLAPDDSSASTNVKAVLTLESPASVTNATVGTAINLGFSVQNVTGISAGEIVVKFDPAVLTATSINETISPQTGDAYVLGVSKKIDNTNGKVSIDIAQIGDGDFLANTKLLDIGFTLKSAAVATTTVTFAPETTLGDGVTNQITTSGLGKLDLKFIPTRCGDNLTQTPNDAGTNEQCDAGPNNGVACTPAYGSNCQYCTNTCTLQTVTGAKCGDGVKQTQEQCDGGSTNGLICTPAYGGSCSYCNTSCQSVTVEGAKCGDGIKQPANGEECDNGTVNGVICNPGYNGNNCNYCSNTCKTTVIAAPKCGDGILQTVNGETCDDGNVLDGDSCSKTCQKICTGDTIAKGTSCISIACRADYVADNTIAVTDFQVLAQNYHKDGIECAKDIKILNSKCYLDIVDLALFAKIYKITNACSGALP